MYLNRRPPVQIHTITRLRAGGAWENKELPEMESLMYSADLAFERVLQKLSLAIAAGVERPDELEWRPREAPWEARPPVQGRYPWLTRLFETASRHAYLRALVAVLERYWGNVIGVCRDSRPVRCGYCRY